VLLESQVTHVKRKNWPACRPVLYHDINAEVPACNRGGAAHWSTGRMLVYFPPQR
jgi:hypothetical protein